MIKRTLVTCLALAVALGGCGSDDSSSSDDQAGADGASTRTTTQEPAKRVSKQRDGDRKRQAASPKKSSPDDGGARNLVDKVNDLPPKRRERLVTTVLEPALKVFGLEGATGTLSADRRTLTVVVPKARACKASSRNTDVLEDAVKQTLPFLEHVVVMVEGGESFTGYVAANCSSATVPRISGRVLFEKSGFGTFESPTLRIRAKRWIVSYTHSGDFFSIFVRKGKKYQQNPISESSPGSGRKKYRGPGAFKLNISGAGDWTIKVSELR